MAIAERYRNLGTVGSLIGHVVLGIFLFANFQNPFPTPPSGIVYSISLEGGKTLGGLQQLETKKDINVAPPKNVSASTTPEEETKPAIKPEPQEEEKPKEKEVIIPEREKPKPTPKPLPPKPKATPAPTAKPKVKEPSTADINKEYQQAMQRYRGESSESTGKGFGAARIGGSGMGGGVQRPPEFFVYRQLLRDRIKRGWNWYNTAADLVTTVVFDISRDGTISNIGLAKGSGNSEFDDSVLRAVAKASPLPPPPAVIYADFKSVKMNFDPRE